MSKEALGRPITPKEARGGHAKDIPPEVYDVFNQFLVKYAGTGRPITIKQDDVVKAILKVLTTTRQDIFDRGWLDIEASYINYGWDVKYDKPGYNEDGYAFWVFTPTKKVDEDD